jgi:2,3-bisphosphoglycerate-dependent phosphoglycerate mutase
LQIIGLIVCLSWMPGMYSLGQTTTVYIVRHAEKYTMDTTNKNPPLSNAGKKRVKALEKRLKGIPLAAVFSTATIRTEETAGPLALGNGVDVQHYDAKNLPALIEKIKTTYAGKNVLVVGHSNTVRPTVNALGGITTMDLIPDYVYNLIYTVMIDAAGKVDVVQGTYGKK